MRTGSSCAPLWCHACGDGIDAATAVMMVLEAETAAVIVMMAGHDSHFL